MGNSDSDILDYTRKTKALIMKLPLNEGKTFTGETVWLDFADYQNCKFEKCDIIIEYGIFKLNGCHFNTCKFIAPTGSPAHAVLLLDGLLKESFILDKHK